MSIVFVNIGLSLDGYMIQQYLNLGVVDELEIPMAPVMFGGGRRLFESLRELLPRLRIDQVLHNP